MSPDGDDVRYMRRALALAERGVGRTAPNPPVGCVLVRDGAVLGEGWHEAAGRPHAEAAALATVGGRAEGATAYVTLEPCNHSGRTGPCTDALIAAGVRRVVLGAADPNPRVTGGGRARLRAAGVEVVEGIERAACRRLIAPFARWVTTGRPLVTLKVATTLDGRIATRTGHSRWVTGAEARHEVHRMRDRMDAVLVGAGTVRDDDPALTTRLPDGTGRDPIRLVLTTAGELPAGCQLLASPAGARTVLITAERVAPPSPNVDIWPVGAAGGGVDVEAALLRVGAEGITSLLVEGGMQVATALLRARRVDRLVCFVAPRVVGGDGRGWAGPLGIDTMDAAIGLTDVRVRSVGADVCIEGDCVYGAGGGDVHGDR